MKFTRNQSLCKSRLALLVATATFFSAATFAMADNWPTWRGPNGNGSAEGNGYPLNWSATENVTWKYEIPGHGASTPAIWGDHIFLTSADGESNFAIAIDRKGNKLWQIPVGRSRTGKHKKATGANSSPITDGKHIYFYFKSGDFRCRGLRGKRSVAKKPAGRVRGGHTLVGPWNVTGVDR